MPRTPSTADLNLNAPLPSFPTAGGVPPQLGPAPLNYAGQPLPPAPAASATPNAAGLMNAFKRRWVLGTLVGLIAAGVAAVLVWMVLPGGKHEARGLIDLPDGRMDVLSRRDNDYESYRKNQIYILKTRDLLTRTVNDPAVASLDMIRGNDEPARMLEENIVVTAAAHSILAITLKGNNLDEMRTVVDSLMKKYVDDATQSDRNDRQDQTKKLEELEQNLVSDIDSTDRQIKIMIRGTGETGGESVTSDPLRERMLQLEAKLNQENDNILKLQARLKFDEDHLGWYKITDKVLENLRASGLSAAVVEKLIVLKGREFRTRPLIADELVKLYPKEELDHLRSVILSAASIPETQQPIISEAKVDAELNKNDHIIRLKKILDEETGILKQVEAASADPKTDKEVANWKEKVASRKRELEAVKKEYRGSAVELIKSQAILELQNEVASLEKDIEVAKESRSRYKQEFEIVQKQRASAAESFVTVAQLRKNLALLHETLNKIRNKLQENRVETKMDSRARIREAAQPLPNNNLNKKLLISSCLGVATFFAAILLVSFLEWRSRRVDGVDQVVNDLGMRIIGTVPTFPNRANLMAAAEVGGANWRFALNEAINSARTMLLHSARNQSMQVVMVTSATQGEGKTSVASQLATSMATAGMRTLIVDCDLRNPSIHKLFEMALTNGVSEILTGDVDPSDAIQPTPVPNLWVIPAGQCSNRVVAALAQGHPLETLFNRLRGQFDFVIVDSCPVLPVADALLIGQHVDGVLFSIMQDISQIPKVVLASEKLTQLNIPLLGAVVNGIKQDIYSYGYNYVKQLPA